MEIPFALDEWLFVLSRNWHYKEDRDLTSEERIYMEMNIRVDPYIQHIRRLYERDQWLPHDPDIWSPQQRQDTCRRLQTQLIASRYPLNHVVFHYVYITSINLLDRWTSRTGQMPSREVENASLYAVVELFQTPDLHPPRLRPLDGLETLIRGLNGRLYSCLAYQLLREPHIYHLTKLSLMASDPIQSTWSPFRQYRELSRLESGPSMWIDHSLTDIWSLRFEVPQLHPLPISYYPPHLLVDPPCCASTCPSSPPTLPARLNSSPDSSPDGPDGCRLVTADKVVNKYIPLEYIELIWRELSVYFQSLDCHLPLQHWSIEDRHLVLQIPRGVVKPAQTWTMSDYRQVVKAVDQLHDVRMIHGDLKDDNVVFVGDHPYLIDFGWSMTFPYIISPSQQVVTGIYRAPEVYRADRVFTSLTPALDTYALGILLYCVQMKHHLWEVVSRDAKWSLAHVLGVLRTLCEAKDMAPYETCAIIRPVAHASHIWPYDRPMIMSIFRNVLTLTAERRWQTSQLVHALNVILQWS
jgi:hypothetical protein